MYETAPRGHIASERTHGLRAKRVIFAVGGSLLAPTVFLYTRAYARINKLRTRGFILAIVALALLTSVGLSLLRPAQTVAATDSSINFQARLETNTGAIVPDGWYNIEFKMYSVSSGGSPEWTEDYTWNNGSANCTTPVFQATGDCRVKVVNGYLTVNLGSITSFPGTINWDQQQWVTMNIGGTGGSGSFPGIGDGEMNPRLQLTGVPYSFRSGQAGGLFDPAGTGAALSWITQTAANVLQLPNEGGTLCIDGDTSGCGFAPGTGGAGYIQNQNASAQTTSNFWISGSGQATTSFIAPTYTGGGAVAVSSGGTNTNLTLTANGTGTASLDTGANGGTVSVALTAGTLNLANSASATTINIGNTSGATGITERVGTGNYSLDGVAGSTYSLGASTTTGTILIGGTAQTGSITLGSSSGTNSVLIGNGAGATTVNIANTETGGAVNIGTAMTTGTVSIGGTGAQTGTISLGIGTGVQTINLATGGTGAKTVTVGSAASTSSLLLQSGTGNLSLQTQGTGTLGVGNNAVAQNLAIGNATGATTVSVLCGTGICGFGNNATSHSTSIGSGTGVSALTLQGGTGGASLDSGTGSITIGNSANNKTITIGASGSTANTTTVNIATSTGASQTVNIGSNSGTSPVTIGSGTSGITLNPSGGSSNQGVLVKPDADTTAAFQIQRAGSSTDLLNADTANMTLTVQAGNDTATLGANLAPTNFSTGWTGTNWTLASTTAAHNALSGHTQALSPTTPLATTSGQVYQISYTITNPTTAGTSLTVALGSTTIAFYNFDANTAGTYSFTDTVMATAPSNNANLTFTPDASGLFTGTISAVSVQLVTQNTDPVLVVNNASAVDDLEVRASSSTTNLFVGLSAGASNATGIDNLALGNNAFQYNTGGSTNLAIGADALQYNTTGNDNSALGYEALQFNTSGGQNTALGSGALSDNTIGSYNVAVGGNSLQYNSSGYSNTAVGIATLQNNTTGSGNLAIGNNALGGNTTGNNNIGIGGLGVNSTGSFNVGIGSLRENNGNANVGIGVFSLYNSTGVSNDTAIGYQALQNDVGGSYNVGLGYGANVLNGSLNLSGADAIGAGTQVGASNTTILGYGLANGANQAVGIGTSFAPNELTVSPQTYGTNGTVGSGTTITQGSGSGTVTGSGTAWTTGMVGGTIYYSDGSTGTITAVSSGTSLTSSNTTGGWSSATYNIVWGGFNVSNSDTVLLQPTSNSNKAFQVQNNLGTTLLNVDTSGNTLSLGVTGSTAIASTINIANTTGNATQTINIGATNAAGNTVLIQGGTGTGVSLQVAASGTIAVGTTVQTSTLDLGNTSASSTTLINGGTGASAISLQAGAGGTILLGTSGSTANATTVDIANTTGNATQTINIGATNAAGNTVLIQGGTGTGVSIQVAGTGTIAIGTTNADTVSLGAVGSTANATTVNIANTTGAAIQTVNLGSLSSTSLTKIQGGTSASAIILQSGNGSTITIGSQTASTTNAIIIGASAATANADNISIDNTSGTNAGTITIGGSGTATGAITLGQSTGSQTVNVGVGAPAAGATQTIKIGTTVSATTGTTAITIGGTSTTTNGATSVSILAGNHSGSTVANGSRTTTDTDSTGIKVSLGDMTSSIGLCIGGLLTGVAPTSGTAYELVDCNNTPTADYAEEYPVAAGVGVGDVVATGTQMVNTYDTDGPNGSVDWSTVKGQITQLVQSDQAYQSNAIGIVSDNNSDFSSTGYNIKAEDNPMSVALNGRVPVNVTTENGPIEPGDYLTTSATIPGYAMKATQAGYVIGRALSSYDGSGPGQVMVFVGDGYYPGPDASSYLQQDSDANLASLSVNGNTLLSNLDVTGDSTLSDLNVSGPTTLNGLTVTGDANVQGNLTVAGNATIGGSLTVTGLTSVADLEVSGHIITSGGEPTSQIQAAAGSDAVVSIAGTDTTGTISITTGSNPTSGSLADILFSKAYGAAPHIVLSPSNNNAAGLRYFKGTTTTNDFMFNVIDNPAPNTTYQYDYFIGQ